MGDRTKTAEELAGEEEEQLRRLEAQRLKRLRGPSGDDLGEEGSASDEEDGAAGLGGFAARRAKRRKREAAGAQPVTPLHNLTPHTSSINVLSFAPQGASDMPKSSSARQHHHALLQLGATFLAISCTARQTVMFVYHRRCYECGVCAAFGLLPLAYHQSANHLGVSHGNSFSFDFSTELQRFNALQQSDIAQGKRV